MAEPIALPFRRERRRRDAFKLGKQKRQNIAQRVIDFYNEDLDSRQMERDYRIQRIAKYRQWVTGKSFPWENSSDQAIPDMAESSLRTQDTLHNAIMSARPVIVSRAILKSDSDKQEMIDDLQDTQFFVEQNGEKVVEEACESFTNDPRCTIFVPWVRENRDVIDVLIKDPIPPDIIPSLYFEEFLKDEWPEGRYQKIDNEGWDWSIENGEDKATVQFFTDKQDNIEMVIRESVTVHDGPRTIVKDFEDVFTPPRVANLQIPSPSNPGGSPHVILRDYPTKDEIARLQRRGFYDLIKGTDVEALSPTNRDESDEEEKRQIDVLSGKEDLHTQPKDTTHGRLTRLLCFDIYDIDGDGINEDVIFWVLLEPRLLLKAKPLTEMYPCDVPMRPLAEGSYIPVKGRSEGISLLELVEGLHDWNKEMIDMMMDNGTLQNAPFGFYRAASNIKPEIMRLGAGDLMPVNDPRSDIFFPNFNTSSQAFYLNGIALARQFQERLTLQGELQAGRVPAGKSSALRTIGGVQTILQQGEARPERILRRFFSMWKQVWQIMYQLNKRLLPDGKEFRISGYTTKDKDPFRKIEKRANIDGTYQFDWTANVLNSSKTAQQQMYERMAAMYLSPIFIQFGLTTPETAYQLGRDWGKALGGNPEKYLNPPSPESTLPRILAEEAIDKIMHDHMPVGLPLEGAMGHFDKLAQFTQSDDLGYLTPDQVNILRAYMQQVGARAQQEQQMLAQAQAAQAAMQAGMRGELRPGQPVEQGQPPVNENELTDEQIERAGRGEG